MASNPESLTPDAALLKEAEDPRFVPVPIITKLVAALRASLDREREAEARWGTKVDAMARWIEQLADERVVDEASAYAEKARAEQAERERAALAAELQRLKEGQS